MKFVPLKFLCTSATVLTLKKIPLSQRFMWKSEHGASGPKPERFILYNRAVSSETARTGVMACSKAVGTQRTITKAVIAVTVLNDRFVATCSNVEEPKLASLALTP